MSAGSHHGQYHSLMGLLAKFRDQPQFNSTTSAHSKWTTVSFVGPQGNWNLRTSCFQQDNQTSVKVKYAALWDRAQGTEAAGREASRCPLLFSGSPDFYMGWWYLAERDGADCAEGTGPV